MKLPRILGVLLLPVLLVSQLPAAEEDRVGQAILGLTRQAHVTTEVLVQYRVNSAVQGRGAVRALVGGVDSREVVSAREREDGRGDLEVIRLAPGRSVADAMRNLMAHPEVEMVEPNWIYRRTSVSNDPQFGSLWGMQSADANGTTFNNPNGSGAARAWFMGNTGSSNIVVAVLDEGVMNTHQDLKTNVWINAAEAGGKAGLDDDLDGYVDDVTGWDFYEGNSTTYDGTVDSHGTHVAGTIGGAGGNSVGVAGVCWNVKIISTKFLGPTGGSTAAAVKAIDYLIKLKSLKKINLVAINASWGAQGAYSQALFDAIGRANKANILFVAAAGNAAANNDVTAFYPANFAQPNVISVAAIDSYGNLASFSDYGAKTVHLGAPGVGIISSYPDSLGAGTSYNALSGTSMAAPHVTGACALYAAAYVAKKGAVPTAAQIKTAILGTASPLSSLAGKTSTGGRLNVSKFYVGSGAAGL